MVFAFFRSKMEPIQEENQIILSTHLVELCFCVISIKLIAEVDNSIFFLPPLVVYLQQVVNLMG
jgi:hypothetical protein